MEETLSCRFRGAVQEEEPLGRWWCWMRTGDEIAQLIVGTQVDAFDPRELLFADNQTLLISSSDPIYLATPVDFRPIPEPRTLLLLGGGMIGLWFKRRQ